MSQTGLPLFQGQITMNPSMPRRLKPHGIDRFDDEEVKHQERKGKDKKTRASEPQANLQIIIIPPQSASLKVMTLGFFVCFE